MTTKYATGASPVYPGGYSDTPYVNDVGLYDHTTYVPSLVSTDVWVVWDLDIITRFNRVRAACYSGGDGTITVHTSTEGTLWTLFDTSTLSAGWLDYDSGAQVSPTDARFVRIHVHDTGTVGVGGGGGGP